MDANVLETMPGKTEKKKIVLVRVDLASDWVIISAQRAMV